MKKTADSANSAANSPSKKKPKPCYC